MRFHKTVFYIFGACWSARSAIADSRDEYWKCIACGLGYLIVAGLCGIAQSIEEKKP
jgi:hypothetical protein